MKLRVLPLLLAACLLLGVCAFAAERDASSGLEYTVEDGAATVTGCFYEGSELQIPSALGGAPVKTIGEGAFGSAHQLQSVIVPEGVETIGVHAFRNCSNLKEITLPASLREIGSDAFSVCSKLQDIYYLGTEAQWRAVKTDSTNTYDDLLVFGEKNDPIYGMNDMPAPDHWSYPGISFCLENNLMRGMARHLFVPDGVTTRAQMVTILWRMAGSPNWTQRYDIPKPIILDLTQDWYKTAVDWAFRAQITSGTGEYIDENGLHLGRYFAPDEPVTRQELVAFLYRFTERIAKMPVTGGAELTAFPDAESVSGWASGAMRWAIGNEILHGNRIGGVACLDPISHATRAQIATLMRNYILHYAE